MKTLMAVQIVMLFLGNLLALKFATMELTMTATETSMTVVNAQWGRLLHATRVSQQPVAFYHAKTAHKPARMDI
jgi:hypothetical protein